MIGGILFIVIAWMVLVVILLTAIEARLRRIADALEMANTPPGGSPDENNPERTVIPFGPRSA